MKSNINLLKLSAANGSSAVSVINLQPENILLPQADGNDTLKPVDDIQNWFPKPSEMYFAIERFSVVPEDLFRSVEIKQIEPATYSNPQCVSDGSRSFSKASPLFCASMKHDEWKTPSYILHKEKAMPRGISLFLDNDKVLSHDKFADPFRAIAGDEKTNTETVMPLEVLKDYIDNAGIESDPSFGRLKTSVTHDDNKYLKLFVGGKKLATNKTNKKPLGNKRDVYWRFKLAKGTDLRPFGMEVVYDSHSPRHWTLIRTSFHDPSAQWTQHGGSKLLVPYYRLQDIDLTTNDGIQDMLRPFDDTDPRKEPETFGAMIDGRAYLACPKVAALFGFHDLLMKASAEPVPLGSDDPDSQGSVLYQALRVLYYECSEPDIQTIIEDLASANYDPEEIGVACKDTLINKMNDLVGDFAGDDDLEESDAESNEDSCDSLDATAKEMLVKAIEMLLSKPELVGSDSN